MNRRVWVGALALGLGGVVSALRGQQPAWRPAQRPSGPPAVVRAASGLPSQASLGRPVAVIRAAADDSPGPPRPFPIAYRAGVAESRPVYQGVEPIATVPAPGAVIAASHPAPAVSTLPLPAPEGEAVEDAQEELFAMDRLPDLGRPSPVSFMGPAMVGPASPMPSGPRPAGKPETEGLGSWTTTFPVTPPVDEGGGPEGEGVLEEAQPRWYASGEYLLWWTKNDRTPVPLVTTGDSREILQTPTGTLTGLAGVLGQASTVVLFDGVLDRNPFSGGRFTLGYYLDDCGKKAVEVSGFFLGQRSVHFDASSAFFPVLSRPFFNVNQGIQFAEATTFPGVSTGGIHISAPSQLWGVEANLPCKWCCGCDYRVDVLGGLRHLNLRESLEIIEDIQALPGGPDPFNGTRHQNRDFFGTTNQFYGAQAGVQGRWQLGRFVLDGRAKLALGVTRQTLDIEGGFTFPPGTPNVDPRPGGLFAEGSNIGHYSRNRFAAVPEVGVNLGYEVCEGVRVSVGYNLLYWSSVARPGDQIDPGLDITQIPNFLPRSTAAALGITPVSPPRPAVLFKDTDYWAQGVTVGVTIRY